MYGRGSPAAQHKPPGIIRPFKSQPSPPHSPPFKERQNYRGNRRSSVEVFKLLVKERKALSFLPAREADGDVTHEVGRDKLLQPEGDGASNGDFSKGDYLRLQILLSSEGLQKRRLSLFLDANTLEEEQGVNILYLAIGL